VGLSMARLRTSREVTNRGVSRMWLESPAIQSESLVDENAHDFQVEFPSTTGHEKPCGNLGGPSSKAKHYSATDSELVP